MRFSRKLPRQFGIIKVNSIQFANSRENFGRQFRRSCSFRGVEIYVVQSKIGRVPRRPFHAVYQAPGGVSADIYAFFYGVQDSVQDIHVVLCPFHVVQAWLAAVPVLRYQDVRPVVAGIDPLQRVVNSPRAILEGKKQKDFKLILLCLIERLTANHQEFAIFQVGSWSITSPESCSHEGTEWLAELRTSLWVTRREV